MSRPCPSCHVGETYTSTFTKKFKHQETEFEVTTLELSRCRECDGTFTTATEARSNVQKIKQERLRQEAKEGLT